MYSIQTRSPWAVTRVIFPPLIWSAAGVGCRLVITMRPRHEALPTAKESVQSPVGLGVSGTYLTSPRTQPVKHRAFEWALAVAV